MNADEALAGTPYLTTGTTDSQKLFDRLLERSRDIHRQAERVGQLVAREAASVFESFGLVLRSEAVAESNQMEHLEWSSQAVRDVVVNNRQLLDLPVNSFVEEFEGTSIYTKHWAYIRRRCSPMNGPIPRTRHVSLRLDSCMA